MGYAPLHLRLYSTILKKPSLNALAIQKWKREGYFPNESITFELPLKKVKFSEFPFVASFDGIELGHTLAEDRGNLYADEMSIRINNVMTNFKSIPDNFTKEVVYTI
jgi:hypothetical protein